MVVPHAIVGKTTQEYHQSVREVKDWSSIDRALVASQQRTDVLAAHTYHHRMSNLLFVLGFEQESRLVLESLKQFI